MPLILGTNSIKDTGYNVANSLRFNSGDSAYLTRPASGSTSSNTIWTISFWTKRANLGAKQVMFMHENASSHTEKFELNFSSDNTFRIETYHDGYEYNVKSSALFRDVSAWYNFVVRVDTTQSTESNRYRVYVNGEQITLTESGSGYPTQNFEFNLGTRIIAIGRYQASSPSAYLDGYLTELVYCDGQSLDPTSFGEFDSDSPTIWKPIDVSGLTFGNNGFYLDFEDSSNLGNDANGGTDFTSNNLSATDQSTDTCTNNFATANPLIANSNVEYSDGNLNTYHTYAGQWRSTISTIGASSGKWYAEYKISAVGTEVSVGNCDVTTITQTSANDFIGEFTDSVGYVNSGSIYKANSVAQGSLTTYTANDIIGIAMDLDNNTIQFYKNGSAIGTTTSLTADKTYAFGAAGYGDARILWNIGSPSFSISSGNADANGFGNFEYSVPSGFFSLCSKNLAEFG